MAKNPFGKTIPFEKAETDAYAVYGEDPLRPGWTWYVIKMNQSPEAAAKNPMASATCKVTSPMSRLGDFGDTYLSDIGGRLLRGVDVRGDRSKVASPWGAL